MNGLEQIGIAVFGVAAIRLSQDARPKVQRWACVCGLLAHTKHDFAAARVRLGL